MTAIGSKIRNDADLEHATRTRRRYALRHWVQTLAGVAEAVGIVALTIALGLLAAWVMGCSDERAYCEAKDAKRPHTLGADGSVPTRTWGDRSGTWICNYGDAVLLPNGDLCGPATQSVTCSSRDHCFIGLRFTDGETCRWSSENIDYQEAEVLCAKGGPYFDVDVSAMPLDEIQPESPAGPDGGTRAPSGPYREERR